MGYFYYDVNIPKLTILGLNSAMALGSVFSGSTECRNAGQKTQLMFRQGHIPAIHCIHCMHCSVSFN